jgi:hypothetical protein
VAIGKKKFWPARALIGGRAEVAKPVKPRRGAVSLRGLWCGGFSGSLGGAQLRCLEQER